MSDTPASVLISIIIPVHNGEETLAYALESCLNQTYGNLQIIVVDDGSSDKSVALASEFNRADKRVKVIEHKENKGRLEARRTGIQAAQGDFIMFLDADDALMSDACERLLAAQEGKFDIVQCSFKMAYAHYVSREDKKFDTEFCRAPAGTAYGDDVVHITFLRRRGTWSLCGKLMRSDLVKKALKQLPIVALDQAEDACLYFLIACESSSFRGLASYEGYIYNIDLGNSDAKWHELDLQRFAYTCGYIDAMNAIRDYLEKNDLMGRFGADYKVLFREHLQSAVDKMLQRVRTEDKPGAMTMLCEHWPRPDIVTSLARRCWNSAGDCWEALANASVLQCGARAIKTIGVYHNAMQIGGAEAVAADLIDLWVSMGYRVVMLCDEPREASAYTIPETVAWVQLPESFGEAAHDYYERATVLAHAIEEHHIDVIVNHQWWSQVLPWDMMLARLMGVPTAVFCHSRFRMLFCEGQPHDVDQVRVFRYADSMIVLSNVDHRFWSWHNPRVFLVTHRLTFQADSAKRAALNGNEIVWIGRLSPHDKHPEEALRIMAYLSTAGIDCTLTMVGAPDSQQYMNRLKKMTRELNIADRVTFTGGIDDVSPLLERASIHLLTSSFEGYCLVLAESKARGVPCVMYELPNLPLSQGHRGIIAVGQRDADAAARAIATLLDDREKLQQLGDDAYEHSLELAQLDFEKLWGNIFEQLSLGTPDRSVQAQDDDLWDEFILGCCQGFEKLENPTTRHMAKQAALKAFNTAKAARWELLLKKYGS